MVICSFVYSFREIELIRPDADIFVMSVSLPYHHSPFKKIGTRREGENTPGGEVDPLPVPTATRHLHTRLQLRHHQPLSHDVVHIGAGVNSRCAEKNLPGGFVRGDISFAGQLNNSLSTLGNGGNCCVKRRSTLDTEAKMNRLLYAHVE